MTTTTLTNLVYSDDIYNKKQKQEEEQLSKEMKDEKEEMERIIADNFKYLINFQNKCEFCEGDLDYNNNNSSSSSRQLCCKLYCGFVFTRNTF
jgi:hypothetical protein